MMKRKLYILILAGLFFSLFLSGCGPAEEIPPTPTLTRTPKPPTSTPEPTATATEIPTPTPLPGDLVIPLEDFDEGIPWLPLDESSAPMVYFVIFNTSKPPFDNVLVRQAFAAATDRSEMVEVTKKYYAPEVSDPRPATSFVPPEILGRDLYGEVGFTYDLELAQDLFAQAGYSDSSTFPTINFLVNVGKASAPGIHLVIAEKLAEMWQEQLGVEVIIEITTWGTLGERLNTNPPEMYRLGWAADYNDPNNFYSNMFETGSQFNYAGYSNSDIDELIRRAEAMTDPAERQLLYIQAEQILCELDPAVIPIYHGFSDLR